jgi:hypothetical protein
VFWRGFFPIRCIETRFSSQIQGFHGEKKLHASKRAGSMFKNEKFLIRTHFPENQWQAKKSCKKQVRGVRQ